MSTTSRRRRRVPASDRELRQEILAATEKLLEEQRFDELAVADILKAANVSRSSFYFYFESKHAVLAELVRTTFGEALEVTRPWLEHDPGDSPRTALELGARQGVKLWLD